MGPDVVHALIVVLIWVCFEALVKIVKSSDHCSRKQVLSSERVIIANFSEIPILEGRRRSCNKVVLISICFEALVKIVKFFVCSGVPCPAASPGH